MKIIVGLGNPGKIYEKTRHNLGFLVLDNYIKENGISLDNRKFDGKYGKFKNKKDETIIFAKPLTYMNNSGFFIINMISYFNIYVDDLLIITDDLEQEFGKIKIKKNSSSGGHNGLKSIIELLGTKDFARLKFGVKSLDNNKKINFKKYVLSNFSIDELNFINKNAKEKLNNLINEFIDGESIENLSKKYNGKIK